MHDKVWLGGGISKTNRLPCLLPTLQHPPSPFPPSSLWHQLRAMCTGRQVETQTKKSRGDWFRQTSQRWALNKQHLQWAPKNYNVDYILLFFGQTSYFGLTLCELVIRLGVRMRWQKPSPLRCLRNNYSLYLQKLHFLFDFEYQKFFQNSFQCCFVCAVLTVAQVRLKKVTSDLLC